MKHLIISPHTDDAIFSMSNFIEEFIDHGDEVIILSVFSGVPLDSEGRVKHTVLNKEHVKACNNLSVTYLFGNFLDDVYGEQDVIQIKRWLLDMVKAFSADKVYIPLGIHHPDHILVRGIFLNSIPREKLTFYSELPYRILYPAEHEIIHTLICPKNKMESRPHIKGSIKEETVKFYESQIKNDHILGEIFETEYLWRI